MSRSKSEIRREISILEDKYAKSRNIVDKARYCAQIKELKSELEAVEHEQKVVFQNDAPSIADHKNTRKLSRGDIANSGNSFIGIL